VGPTPAIFVRLTPFQDNPDTVIRAYRIAGCRVWVDSCLTALEVFREPRLQAKQFSSQVMPKVTVQDTDSTAERQAEGWVGGVRQAVRCGQVADGYVIQSRDLRFFVRDDGKWIELLDHPESDSEMTDLLLGPVLVLALALQQRWCLHGGAVIQQGSAIVFLGESGFGKSTIAAWLSAPDSAMQRLADDIVPVAMNGLLHSLPPFPQFNLPGAQQYVDSTPIAVEQIYVLEPGTENTPVTHDLPAGTAALAVARHTLLARLFPESLLAKHFKFCAQVAETTDVAALEYPHTQQSLDMLKQIIERD
jgi:hypothetical protein